MFRRLESVIPPFLKKIDKDLLLNRPGLWATRIHYFLFFFAVGAGLLALKLFTQFIPLHDVPSPDTQFLILLIPAVIGFLAWTYRASLFQVEKTFGQRQNGKGFRDQAVYVLIMTMLAGAPLAYGYLLSEKIQRAVPEDELVEDLNNLNLGESLFVTDEYYLSDGYYSKDANQVIASGGIVFSGYVRYTYYSFYHQDLYNENQVRRAVEHIDTREEKLRIIENFIHSFNKYSSEDIDMSAEKVLSNYENQSFSFEQKGYESIKYDVSRNLQTIQQAHAGKFNIMDREFMPFYLFFLSFLWLALNVFLKTNWKIVAGAAILGIASIASIGITAGLIQTTLGFFEDELIFGMATLLFGVMLYQAFRKKHTSRIKAWKTIALSAVTVATPIMPLVIVSMFGNHLNNDEAYVLMYTGIFAGILWWNLLYQRQFIKLEANPREN